MNAWRTWFAWLGNGAAPGRRLILGALLTVLGLGARGLVGGTPVGDAFLIGATLLMGRDVAARAIFGLRRRTMSIELLITVAVVGALAIGEFWEATAVTLLFSGGAYLEARVVGRVRQALARLLDLAPPTARVRREGQVVEVAPADVRAGETVLVRPGERIPVDGEVLVGLAVVDESPITGESRPRERSAGDHVYAGTITRGGVLQVRATAVGVDTTLGRIIQRVEEAQEAKAPTQRLIERFARWYTPLIIALGVSALVVTRDLRLALTFLVIGCPGALVLATPIAVMAGIGRAAQRGILIKDGEHLETVGKVSAVALDKTGTLTTGSPRVTDRIIVHDPPPIPDLPPRTSVNTVLQWAAIAESGSTHPVARAILDATSAVPLPDDVSFAPDIGRGVRAFAAGHTITVGAPGFVGDGTNPTIIADLARLRREGKMAVLVAVDEDVVGIIGIADTPRPSAADGIRLLKGAGIRRIVMLTGDHAAVARAIGRVVGVDEVHAGLLPDDKLAAIRQIQADGHVVAMIGDGINDAPALAAADVGVAMGMAGSDAAIETADLVLMTDDLARLAEAVRLSRATVGIIRQNIVIAVSVVAALLLGVVAGDIQLAGGMLVHELSVLVVTLNALRLLRL